MKMDGTRLSEPLGAAGGRVFLGGTLAALVFAAAPAQAEPLPAPSELLVDMVDDTGDADEQALEALLGRDLRLTSAQGADERFFVADAAPGEMARLLKLLEGDPRVENAEPNWVYGLPEGEAHPLAAWAGSPPDDTVQRGPQPDDPLWAKQWSFRMIGAPEAWTKATGKGVVVAVIDTGVAFEKYKQFQPVEDLDVDRFVEGYNFITDTPHANDDHGHGTHVAGTIAQSTFNARGVAGIAYEAKIMPLKVLSKRGMGTAGDIADAVRFAADEGAHVMNLSLGGGPRSRVLESAVAYARRKGTLVICAAGNNGRPKVEFPAAYAGAFAVSSVGPTKDLAFYSSYGPEIAVAGPGGDKNLGGDDGGILQNTILTTRPELTGMYLSYQGTSMATPHVAGVAALVISAGVTNPDRVEEILRETAEDLGSPGRDDRFGHGLVNAASAVTTAHAERGGLAAALTALLGLLGLGLSHARRFGVASARALLGPGAWVGAVFGAMGLSFLPGVFGLPAAMLGASGLGSTLGGSFIWASVLPVLGAVVLGFGLKSLRGALFGLVVGWATHWAVAGAFGSVDVLGIPGAGGAFDRAWLLLQAGLSLGLAVLMGRAIGRTASKVGR